MLDYVPHYLTYTDKPVKSDAIVLFVGPDYKTRQDGAEHLLAEGYARFLIIPAFETVTEVSSASYRTGIKKANPRQVIIRLKTKAYHENTHVEVIEAKRIMEQYGLKSAIFVSSPDHMCRIKIITEKVFDKSETRIAFVPTRAVPVYHGLLNQTLSDFESMGRECIKIAWFLIYSTFQPQT